MKMVLTLNVDELFNQVDNADFEESRYKKISAKECEYIVAGKYNEYKKHRDYAYNGSREADAAVFAITCVLGMDLEAQTRLRIAVRAKNTWERKTNYERLLPERMKQQFANFIFGEDDNFVVEKSWWDGEYRKV